MESRRLICDAEIPTLQPKLDAFSDSYRKSLKSLRAISQETAQYQAKIEEAKAELREAEDDFVKAQGAKTHKEAKHMALMDAIAPAKTRVEDLKSSIMEKRTKNFEYAKFLSQHSLASQGTVNESTEQKDEIQEAISWYNTVLGFHVEGGDGVKFTFKNINTTNPKVECFFTIRHENDAYTLLNCEPSLKGTKEMIHELNRTNGLYKFVRVIRRNFQEAVTQGMNVAFYTRYFFMHRMGMPKFLSSQRALAPDLSISSFRSDSPTNKNKNKVQASEGDRSFKKQTLKREAISAALSAGSASSLPSLLV